jgi:hypothetical protein
VDLVEAARTVDRPEQKWFLADLSHGEFLHGPGGTRQVLGSDVYALHHAGYLAPAGGSIFEKTHDWVLTGEAIERYAEIRRRQGEAFERGVEGVRRYFDSEAFAAAYPLAYAKWQEAEALLWGANTEREYTTVGHKARETMQEFATEVVSRYQPPDPDPAVAKVNRRLGAVIAMKLPSLGDARANLLKSLGDYWEATNDVVQRQEHGGQKEDQPLEWEDARRVVFHTASVMYEFARAFEAS